MGLVILWSRLKLAYPPPSAASFPVCPVVSGKLRGIGKCRPTLALLDYSRLIVEFFFIDDLGPLCSKYGPFNSLRLFLPRRINICEPVPAQSASAR